MLTEPTTRIQVEREAGRSTVGAIKDFFGSLMLGELLKGMADLSSKP